ncbi:hypothetical protein Y032_0477g2185 [Ancylostoma ceylanicum]|nr:hypothetical protein Y032_0477g2185 [Ancylostoma ceylanicum]
MGRDTGVLHARSGCPAACIQLLEFTIQSYVVPVVQEAFMPPAEKVEWATELVHAFSQHQAEGKGAFQFRGQMIDRPLLLQALNIIQLVESVGGISTGK